ncbi:MAG: ATP-binding cassette domain-containing protein, partial [Gammaproteobacteria bacterium]|nr:ATP-binding cassette domain-containing protein [Gammaproteobacteria bacterium]
LKLRGRAGNAEIERLLDEVGLADRAAQAARLLSGGEQQRLTLARALATGPKVLFLDEPTASLDPASTAAIEAIVTRAYQRGTKILFVTHDIGQAHRLADDVIFLNHGRVTEHTPAKTFFEAPASQAALDYLDGRLVIR